MMGGLIVVNRPNGLVSRSTALNPLIQTAPSLDLGRAEPQFISVLGPPVPLPSPRRRRPPANRKPNHHIPPPTQSRSLRRLLSVRRGWTRIEDEDAGDKAANGELSLYLSLLDLLCFRVASLSLLLVSSSRSLFRVHRRHLFPSKKT